MLMGVCEDDAQINRGRDPIDCATIDRFNQHAAPQQARCDIVQVASSHSGFGNETGEQQLLRAERCSQQLIGRHGASYR
jgi:hypothetical protein